MEWILFGTLAYIIHLFVIHLIDYKMLKMYVSFFHIEIIQSGIIKPC